MEEFWETNNMLCIFWFINFHFSLVIKIVTYQWSKIVYRLKSICRGAGVDVYLRGWC